MPNCYSVADHGALPGDPASVAAAFRSIRDDFRSQRKRLDIPYPCRVRFPAADAPWVVGEPLQHDISGMSLVGDGAGLSVIEAARGYQGDLIQSALSPCPIVDGAERPLSPDHWPSTAGVFDSSVGPTVGFRTLANAHLAFQGTPLDVAWDGMGVFTLDLCLVMPESGMPCGTFLAIGSVERGERPIRLDSPAPGVYRLEVTCSDRTKLVYTFPAPSGRVHRLAFFVDPAVGRLMGWLDGSRPAAATWSGLFGEPDPARVCASPDDMPLLIGAYGEQFTMAGQAGKEFGAGNSDFTLAALCLTKGARYNPNTDALLRLDGKPVTDANTYFDAFYPGCIALIPFNAPNVKDDSGSLVRVHHGGSWDYSFGRALPSDAISSAKGGFVKDLTIRDLTIRHVDGSRYGNAVAVGLANGMKIRDCDLSAGHTAIGPRNVLSAYRFEIDSCRLAGSHAGLSSYGWIADCRNLTWHGQADHCAILSGEVSIRDSFAGDGAARRSVVRVRANPYGSSHILSNVRADGESAPPDYFLDAELSPGKMPCSVVLEDCLAARVAKAPYRLTAGGTDPNNWRSGTLAVSRFRLQNPAPASGVVEPAGMWVVDEKVMTPAIGGQS